MRLLKFLLPCLIIFVGSCKKNQHKEMTSLPSTTGQYLVEYTPSRLSVGEALRFRFAKDIVTDGEVGSDKYDDLLSIAPNVDGTLQWLDKRTIQFTPSDQFAFDQKYIVRLHLDKVFNDLEKELKTISLPYFTNPLSLDISFSLLDYSDQDVLSLQGMITSNDQISHQNIEDLIQFNQKENQGLSIDWKHSSSTRHGFTIQNISRAFEDSKLEVKWNGKSYDKNFDGTRFWSIQSKGEFACLEAQANQGDGNAISLSFSDPLDAKQSFNGLINIPEYKGKLNFDVQGSQLIIYPGAPITGNYTVQINENIKRRDQIKLSKSYQFILSNEAITPQVRLLGKGVIVPEQRGVIFPFEAINLKSVVVEIFEIYSSNVLQFLQYNQFGDTWGLDPVGKVIAQELVDLNNLNTQNNQNEFIRYALDLQKITQMNPGSIYQVRLGFYQENVKDSDCSSEQNESRNWNSDEIGQSILNYTNYDYKEADNICAPSFYNPSRFVSRNVLASNIGLIVKKEPDNDILAVVTDLRTTVPISNCEISVFDFQQQLIGEAKTGSDGMANLELRDKASFIIVKNQNEFSYLSLKNRHANSLSEFDVSGRKKQEGIDGFIYGERGVWRPGDQMYLNFVLEDKEKSLPDDHPVTMIVKNSKNQEVYRKTTSQNVGNIFHFSIPTNANDPSGDWKAIVHLGNKTFQKYLKVETVKPNRLKIDVDVEGDRIVLNNQQNVQLSSTWLHGAAASNLKAKMDVQLYPIATNFIGYASYIFDDAARKIEPIPIVAFDGNLNANGKAKVLLKKNKNWLAPGKMHAKIKTKVFEKSGNFSEDFLDVAVDIYDRYVGIKVPKTQWGSKFIPLNTKTNIPIVLLDNKGNPLANQTLEIGLYKAEWNWWYDRHHSRKYNYNSGKHIGAIEKKTIKTNAEGKVMYPVSFDSYGNYMVRVCDPVSGHCTGDMFYTGRSWSSREDQEGAQQLLFTSDQSTYKIGDKAKINIPTNEHASLFVSVENGEEVLDAFWVETKAQRTEISIPLEQRMRGTIYVHAQLIQKHQNGNQDMPLRMYGVIPIRVEDPKSHLYPEIVMPDVLAPNEKYTISVSEKNGQMMSYTLAVVDEGLLDLTKYKTPDLWNHFYAKQTLGIKTWDVYDWVLTGYGVQIDHLISIGGDMAKPVELGSPKANRFPPMVRFLGPFQLKKGQTMKHDLTMSHYVGSVKVMVVGRSEDTYGSEDKTVKVKQDVMVLSTLPRVLGPGESLEMPANIFTMSDQVKEVNLEIQSSPLIRINSRANQTLYFNNSGDQMAYVPLEVGAELGIAEITTTAQSRQLKSQDKVSIPIRNPNPIISKVDEQTIAGGKNKNIPISLFGSKETQEAWIEVSQIPMPDISNQLEYLIQYPYGCLEQTVSSIFPQLFVEDLIDLPDRKSSNLNQNINVGLQKLARFQLGSGAFSYWQGSVHNNDWGTSYAGHFLLEAEQKGFMVPANIINQFIQFQHQKAEQFVLPKKVNRSSTVSLMNQAYRLYTLAKAGKANIGAMNRLRYAKQMNTPTTFLLGAAYGLIGKPVVAEELISGKSMELKTYRETGGTYGSHIRDMAIIAESMLVLNQKDEALIIIKKMVDAMKKSRWHSTQTTSFALMVLGKVSNSLSESQMEYEISINGNKLFTAAGSKPVMRHTIDLDGRAYDQLEITNDGSSLLFAKMITRGQELVGDESGPASNHIAMDINYFDVEGASINPEYIAQGTDFKIQVDIKNLATRGVNIDELALRHIIPSGWEISNDRLNGGGQSKRQQYEYRDIRDDRIHTFFDLKGKESKRFVINVTATYKGRFYMPGLYCEAMYDEEIQARSQGKWITVF